MHIFRPFRPGPYLPRNQGRRAFALAPGFHIPRLRRYPFRAFGATTRISVLNGNKIACSRVLKVDRGKGNPVRSLPPRHELHPVWRGGDAPNLDGLYEGARSAMNRFPTSASCINGQSPTASRRSNKIRRAGYQWSPSVRLALTITRRFPGELSKSSGNNSFFR